MQQNLSDINFLFPENPNLEKLQEKSSLEPFSDKSVEFLHALSIDLNRHPDIRLYPDVATFAFYCRRSNILKLKNNHYYENQFRVGRGLIFHIAPSNVPVNFAYSLLCGILSGSSNIVRVPSKNFDQVSIICNSLKEISKDSSYSEIVSRIALIRYDKSSSATDFFSSLCNVRIIWGGDDTIAQIRKSNIPARSFDITFADRYSIAIINASEYLKNESFESVASGFYNDTYLFDQNACTAPHLLIWLGQDDEVAKAQDVFWCHLLKVIRTKYGEIQAVVAVDKLTAFYKQAVYLEKIHLTEPANNLLWRIKLEELNSNIDKFRCSSGYFSEYRAKVLDEITTIINSKYQTLAYYGISRHELITFLQNSQLNGIDRIVPIGHTTDFSLIWDGFDLISTLTRVIDIVA